MNRKLDLISYLKGYAIFTIVAFHLITYYNFYNWPNIIRFASTIGAAGIHVFFVCSGFGLFFSYLKKPISYMQFLKKRFLKLYIPYIVIILISACIPFMYNGNDRINAVLSHIFLFKMFSPIYEHSFGAQFWFISTIIQFYLVFYILIYLKNKLGSKKYLIISIIISLVYGILVILLGKMEIRTWDSFFLQYLWEFSLGMIFAEYFCNSQQSYKSYKSPKLFLILILSILGFIMTGLTSYLGGIFRIFIDYTLFLGYGSLAYFIYLLNIKYINTFFIWINKFSYEWYLIHILIFECMRVLLIGCNSSIFLFILVFIISMCSALIYNVIIQKFKGLLLK